MPKEDYLNCINWGGKICPLWAAPFLACPGQLKGKGAEQQLTQSASLLPYCGWDPPSCFEPWLPGKEDQNLDL